MKFVCFTFLTAAAWLLQPVHACGNVCHTMMGAVDVIEEKIDAIGGFEFPGVLKVANLNVDVMVSFC